MCSKKKKRERDEEKEIAMFNPSDFKVAALKEVLREVGLSTSGKKNELIARLKAADPSGTWVRRVQEVTTKETTGDSEMECEDNAEGEESGTVRQRNDDAERLLRELELRREEKRAMEREFEIMRRELERLRTTTLRDARTPGRPDRGEEAQYDMESKVNVKAIAELLPPFSGDEESFDRWERQLQLLKATYTLDDKAVRILIGSRLRGRALDWLYSKAEFLEITVTQLLEEMRSMFGRRISKLVLRKEFEGRVWKYGESFSEYLHDKIILANKVPVAEDEVVDYIVEGIPDPMLRDQARIQKLKTTESLREAFERVKLRPKSGQSFDPSMKKKVNNPIMKNDKSSRNEDSKTSRGSFRCYNCNDQGHLARDCKQVKKEQTKRREQTTCFNCGVQGHLAKYCKTSVVQGNEGIKEQISNVTETSTKTDHYMRNVRYELLNELECVSLKLESLFDTGSAVSFIKIKFVPPSVRLDYKELNPQFCGINNSKLKILGMVKVRLFLDDITKDDVTLLVVSNDTMKPAVILGRDILYELGYTLERKQEPSSEWVDEILNIDIADEKEERSSTLDINTELPTTKQSEVRKIFEEDYLKPERPEIPAIDAEVKLILKEHQPFAVVPRRLSYTEKNVVRDIINELLEKKVIKPSESEYSSPIVLVRKKNGEFRMCVDFRVLNKHLIRSHYPLPLIEDQLDVLLDKKYFTLLDLKDGFYHIRVANESIKYTSFVTPLGQYEYQRMPFGLKIAPIRFQKFVNEVLREFINSGDIVAYMDDFMIATSTIEHHLQVLRKVFRALVNNRLDLRLDKCKFLYTRIEYLGYVVSEKGISPSNEGVEAVYNFPIPKNVREVRGFVGLCSYFRKFIEKFAVMAKPLYDLLRKDVTFEFEAKALKAFEELKAKLISAPILSIYNPRDKTELHCDASSYGFGAILFQRKQDLKLHPIFYYSKRTTETESRYHSFELETLAIIYALRRFRVYLHGIKFTILTDCQSLKMTLDKKDINPRISRWALELQEFDYVVEHRSGSKMSHVDCLSRCYSVFVIEDNTLEFNLAVSQSQDPNIKDIRTKLENSEDKWYEMRNGVVYRKKKDKLLFVVPSSMESRILYKYHDELGHVGVEKVCEVISKNYWFPEMKSKVEAHVANCLKCIAYSPKTGKREGMLQIMPKEQRPFEVIHIDHFGPVEKDAPKKYVLVVIDAFTKFVKLYATKSTSSKEVVSCLEQYFHNYSSPKVIISDRGTGFSSKEFESFVTKYEIKHIKIATGSPQANGQAERVNRVIRPMLAKVVDSKDRKSWYKSLPLVEYVMNNVSNKSIGDTPSRVLFGVDQRLKSVDNVREFLQSEMSNATRSLEEARTKAKDAILKAQNYNKNYVDAKRKEPPEYVEGDYVMVRNFESTPGMSHKLIPQFRGPYQIVKKLRNNRYVIADVEGFQVTQRPYKGVWEPANMRPWLANQ